MTGSATWRDYYELTKPRVVMLIVFTAIVGMFLAVPGLPDLTSFLVGTIGIGMAASSAAAVNHVLDVRIDSQMTRTRERPLPRGKLTESSAFTFAGVLCAISMLLLWFVVNPLTAILTFISLIGYAGVYTAFLKRATPQNIVIGGAAGAAPPVLGWTAVTGRGRIYSWERPWHPVHPALRDHGPYIVVLVELDGTDGLRMLGNLLGDPMQEVRVGAAVEAVFEHHETADPAYTLLQWKYVD